MSNTPVDSEAYLNAAAFSFLQLFTSFVAHQQLLSDLREETLATIQRAKQLQRDIFVDLDQWSVNANYYYGQYIQRLQQLDSRENTIDTTGQDQIDIALARMGATEESMAVIAGAILQVAKQVLSFRFGAKGNLPASRMIASQSLTEVIWEGRNHAMHWEEQNPRPPVVAMMQALANDLGVQFIQHFNNSWAILAAIGWQNENDAMEELEKLIQ